MVDGIGSDGLKGDNAKGSNVHNVRVPYVHHSIDEGKGYNPGLSAADTLPRPGKKRPWYRGGGRYSAATTWLTRYMAATYYAGATAQQGDLRLSKHGQLPGGTKLAVNKKAWMYFDYNSTPNEFYPEEPTITYGQGAPPE